jgi:hypothetical protein
LHDFSGLLSLCKKSIFYDAGILVKESWCFSAEVLKDFKTVVAYAS